MKNIDKTNFYKLWIAIVMCTFIFAGLSFAYFSANFPVNQIEVGGEAGEFEINLITEEEGYINVTGMQLIYEHEKEEKAAKGEFKVITGNNSYAIKYTISLVELHVSENLLSTDFKWHLICLNDTSKSIYGTFKNADGTTFLLNENLLIGPDSIDEYELLIWLQESGTDQITLMNGEFEGKISITAGMQYKNP